MIKDPREIGIVFFAFAMFFTSGLTHVHAKASQIEATTIRVERLMSFARWYVVEVARIAETERYGFAPGN